MTRELLLLRHGKSDWSHAVGDFERPLKKRGREGASRIGRWLSAQNLIPDIVLSSPAQRARETAELCLAALGDAAPRIHFDERLYHAENEDFEAILQKVPKLAQRVLVVGHNFGMQDFLLSQCSAPPRHRSDGKLLTTATLAQLSYPGGTLMGSPGSAQLKALVRARDLGDTFD